MRHSLLFLLSLATLSLSAQTSETTPQAGAARPAIQTQPVGTGSFTFGVLSYSEALRAMPEYATVQRQMAELKAKYDAEAKRAEDDFNSKYEDFLEGQRDFPPTILQKRQSELQEMMAKNIAFRDESRRLLDGARTDAMAPLHQRLASLLKIIGEKEGFSFILNTDNNACPFVNAAQGKDINQLVKDCLK